MNRQQELEYNLAGPCGFYCGTCRHYLARSKGLLEEKNLKHGCKGCRLQTKICAWVRRDCVLLRKHHIDFCFECADFPCEKLRQFDRRHVRDDHISPIENLRRIQQLGAAGWLKEQEEMWRCPECGGNLCVIDRTCYDCGYTFS